MQAVFTKSSAIAVLFGLAACGGGDDIDGGGGGVSPPSTNGLPYATTQNLSQAEGVQITADGAQVQDGTVTRGPGTITLDSGWFSGTLDGTVTIFGEQVTISGGAGTLVSTGQEVRVIFDENRSGNHAATIQVITYDAPQAGAIDGEVGYVLGFETSPSQVDARSGSLVYAGDFVAGGVLNGTTEAEYEGAVTFTVNFNNNNVTGSLDGDINGGTAVDLTLAGGTSLNGNGFSGALNCGAGCTSSSSQVDATFYGPNAAELGGVLALDFNNFDGAGTFILTNPTQP